MSILDAGLQHFSVSPRPLGSGFLGFWFLGLRVWGQGLTISLQVPFMSRMVGVWGSNSDFWICDLIGTWNLDSVNLSENIKGDLASHSLFYNPPRNEINW